MLDESSELTEQFGIEALQAVHESDRDGLVYFSRDGTIEYVNRAATEIFGVDESIIGENIFDLRDRNFADFPYEIIYASDHFEKALRTFHRGVPARSEMIIAGEERREIEVIWGPVRRDGEVVGVVGSYRDVTPRPNVHDQLAMQASRAEEQRQLLASVLDQTTEGVLVFDGDLVLELANRAALDLLEVEPPVEGLTLGECLEQSTAATPSRLEAQCRGTVESGASSRGTYRLAPDRSAGEGATIAARTGTAGDARGRYVCTLERIDTPDRGLARTLLAGLTRPDEPPGAPDDEDLAERIVDRLTEETDLDIAVFSDVRDGRLHPIAWRGAMIDADRTVELEQIPELASCFEDGRARQFDRWLWHRSEARGQIEQLAVPLAWRDQRLAVLQIGSLGSGGGGPEDLLGGSGRSELEILQRHLSALFGVRTLDREHTRLRDRLETLIDAAPVGVVLFDRRGDVLATNERARAVSGYEDWSNLNADAPPYEIRGLDGDPIARSNHPFFRAVEGGEPVHQTVTFDFGDETRLVDIDVVQLSETSDQQPTWFAGFLRTRGSTGRRGDALLEIAGHELRSPLTPLTGLLQLARRQCERGDAVDLSLLTRAERQVSRLTRLVGALEDATELERGELDLETEVVDAVEFVEKCVTPWRANPKDVEIELDLPERRIAVECDPDRLHQVVTNLVDNAVKYSDGEGGVAVSVGTEGDDVQLTVEDEGVGMDEELTARVFDRYECGTPPPENDESTGLGLYISHQIVEQHGGSIDIESERGEGTRVEVTLPGTDD